MSSVSPQPHFNWFTLPPKYFISPFSKFNNQFLIPLLLYLYPFLSPHINYLCLPIDCELPCPFKAIFFLTLPTFPYIAKVTYAHIIYLIKVEFDLSWGYTVSWEFLRKITNARVCGCKISVYVLIASSYTMKNKAGLFVLPKNVTVVYLILINFV